MSSLQSQLHDLHKEISRRDSEITTHQQTIKMMQEKQRYLSGEVSQHFMILSKIKRKNVAYPKNQIKKDEVKLLHLRKKNIPVHTSIYMRSFSRFSKKQINFKF